MNQTNEQRPNMRNLTIDDITACGVRGHYRLPAQRDKPCPNCAGEFRADVVELVRGYIRTHWTPAKRLYRGRDSYGFKHDAERALGVYVANGEFIAAALAEGYRATQCEPSHPNAFFAVRQTRTVRGYAR